MIRKLFWCGCALSLLPALSPAGNTEDVLAVCEKLKQVPYNKIIEDPELRREWWEMVWKAWDYSPAAYQPDFSDFDKNRFFNAPPPPNEHPRLFLRKEMLPELRDRLKNSASGRAVWERYKKECDLLRGNKSACELFEGLASGRSGPEFEKLYADNIGEVATLMMWDSLRVLVEDDKEFGKKMAAALVNYAMRLQRLYDEKGIGRTAYFQTFGGGKTGYDIRSLPTYMKDKTLGDKDYQSIYPLFNNYCVVPTYDFLHDYMTDEQRTPVRKLIGDLTSGLWIHGMGSPGTGGNWGPCHWQGTEAAICIEGEQGFDPKTVEGLRQVMTSFYSNDFTKAGAILEGLGKGTFGTSGIPVAALRGWDVAASQPVRRAVKSMIMNAKIPNSGCIVAEGGLGSSFRSLREMAGCVGVLKYFYPKDPVIDYLHRLAVGENYENIKNQRITRHFAGLWGTLLQPIYMVDYDEAKTLAQAEKDAVESVGRTFFCPDYSLLITKSDWSPDAAWLYFYSRTRGVGHARQDRGNFIFAAEGRQWSVYPMARNGDAHASSYDAHNCSVVTIDGVGTLGDSTKMIAYADSDDATFATADLKLAWDWMWNAHNNTSQEVCPVTLASLEPLYPDQPLWHYIPTSLIPHWRNPGYPSSPDFRVPHYPVIHAYRTVGLVRQADANGHHYLMVLDDTRKDDASHLYRRQMAVQDDVRLESVKGGDITLVETPGKEADEKERQPRRLLIRVLQASEEGPGLKEPLLVRMEDYHGASSQTRRLAVGFNGKGVRFKILLFAYKPGTPLPETIWQGSELSVRWPGQNDTFDFKVDEEGMTRFSLERNGLHVLKTEPRHVPVPGKPPGPQFARGYERQGGQHE